jgi:hypothetical protein
MSEESIERSLEEAEDCINKIKLTISDLSGLDIALAHRLVLIEKLFEETK